MTNLKRILVVGTGSIGERHARCFLATGRAQVSICEPRAELRKAMAERYELAGTFEDFDTALEQPQDAAVICTPANLHIPIAQRLAEANVHLLIEKPLSTDLEGVDALEREVERRGLAAAVAYVHRAHPALAAMKTAIDSGRFGEVVEIVAISGQHFPTFRPAYREIYYARRETGGGAVQDALTHVVNAVEWLAGPIETLTADFAHQVLEGVEVEDTVHMIARHGRVLASYALNQHQAPSEFTITAVCTRGTARYDLHRNLWKWMVEPHGEWVEHPAGNLDRDTMFIRQAESFLDTLERRAAPLCTLREGAQTLQANLAVLTAAAEHRWVEIREGRE